MSLWRAFIIYNDIIFHFTLFFLIIILYGILPQSFPIALFYVKLIFLDFEKMWF